MSKEHKMIQRAINIVLIVGANAIMISLASVFFIGSEETYNQLKQDLFRAFAGRAFGGFVLGLFASLLILVINVILNHWKPKDQRVSITRVTLIALISTTLSSIIGTMFFFSW